MAVVGSWSISISMSLVHYFVSNCPNVLTATWLQHSVDGYEELVSDLIKYFSSPTIACLELYQEFWNTTDSDLGLLQFMLKLFSVGLQVIWLEVWLSLQTYNSAADVALETTPHKTDKTPEKKKREEAPLIEVVEEPVETPAKKKSKKDKSKLENGSTPTPVVMEVVEVKTEEKKVGLSMLCWFSPSQSILEGWVPICVVLPCYYWFFHCLKCRKRGNPRRRQHPRRQ